MKKVVIAILMTAVCLTASAGDDDRGAKGQRPSADRPVVTENTTGGENQKPEGEWGDGPADGVVLPTVSDERKEGRAMMLNGMPAPEGYRGIVIVGGRKVYRK